MTRRLPEWLVPVAFGLMVLMPAAVYVARAGFDGLYGQDPYGYYDYAVGPLRESLFAGRWPPSPLLWPAGYPLLIVVGSFFAGVSPVAGQAVSWLCALAIPLLTWLLTDALVDAELADTGLSRRAARVTAALVAAPAAQLVQSAIVVMADIPALAAATLSAWALVRARHAPHSHWLVLSASALAWTITMRWSGLVLVPIWLTFLLVPCRDGRSFRTRLWRAAVAAVICLAWLTPVLAMQAATSRLPYAGYEWRVSHAFATAIDAPDGLLLRNWPNSVFYLLAPGHRYYFTWFIAPFTAAGAFYLVRARAWRSLWLTLGWAGATYVLAAGAAPQNFRFTLAFLTPLAVVTGIGIAWALARLRGALRVFAMAALVAGISVMIASSVVLVRRIVAIKQADLETTRWVDAQTPDDAIVLAFSVTLTLQHYGHRETRELYEQRESDLRRLLDARLPAFLLVEVDSMSQQWRDRAPGRNFRWLETNGSPILIGRQRTFSLFRLQPPAGS